MSSLGLKIHVPKESIIKLSQWQKQEIVVKCLGGRQISGILRSWDKTLNMVLDNAVEMLQISNKEEITRVIGLIIVKGTQVHSVSLKDGYGIIQNPYLHAEVESQEKGQGEEEEENHQEDEEEENQEKQEKQKEK